MLRARSRLAVLLAVGVGLGLVATPAEAINNWTLYHSGTIAANTYIYTGYATTWGNNMTASYSTEKIAIFQIDTSNNQFYFVYGNGSVHNEFIGGNMKSACWNRETSTITANCAREL